MFTPPETLEAAEAARVQQEQDAAQDELFKDPEYVADLKARNLASSPYGRAFVAPEDWWEDVQVASLWNFDIWKQENTQIDPEAEAHDETWDIIYETPLDEEPGAPFVNRLVWDNVISHEVAEEIKLWLANNENFSEIINGQSDISSQTASLITDRWEELHNPEATETFQINFARDFEWEIKDFQTESGDYTSPRAQEVIESLWSAYMTSGEEIDKIEQDAALDMAFETAANTAIDNYWASLKRTTEFEVAYENVKDAEIPFEERVEALMSMMDMMYNEIWAKWKNAQKNLLARKKREALRNAWLEEQHNQQEIALREAQEAWDKVAIQKAQLALQETIEQAQDLSGGDIWAWWDTALEVWWSEVHETTQKIA